MPLSYIIVRVREGRISYYYNIDSEGTSMSGFEDYSQFLILDHDSHLKKKGLSAKLTIYDSDSCDEVFSPANIDAILKKKFEPTKYPLDCLSANLFCPICGKEVKQDQGCSVYKSDTYRRNFLAHDSCLTQQNTRLLSDVFDNIDEMVLTPAVLPKKGPLLNLSDREFCLQLAISHPLSNFSFLKMITKKTLQSNILRWQFKQASEEEDDSMSLSFCYQPNTICFPFIDFNLTLTYSQIGVSQSKKTLKNYINMSRMKLNSVSSLIAAFMEEEELKVEFNVHNSLAEKEQLTQSMNYKYKYSLQLPVPIIELVAIEISVPEEYENDEKYYEESNPTITQLISDKQEDNLSSYATSSYHNSAYYQNYENYENYDNFDSVSSVNSGKLIVYPNCQADTINSTNSNRNRNKGDTLNNNNKNKGGNNNNSNNNNNMNNNNNININISSNSNSAMVQKQKVDLQKLILTNKLSSFVRNNTQSRIFQNFLVEQASFEQVDQIIHHLYDEITDLITDEYANYMVQKLYQVSLPNQRILILTKLYPDIPGLVKNKQGTHTVQAFLDYFQQSSCEQGYPQQNKQGYTQQNKYTQNIHTQNRQQYKLVCSAIEQDFEHLCLHPISTHFIQKIIKSFPIEVTLHFYHIANQNFLKFATDQNAMCVLKYMLRRIKEHEHNPSLFEIKKHFINSITFTTHKIIQDRFGNYVVQFCYELFGEAKSSGITEMILERFSAFSLQKYSSSVLLKCINTYWTDRAYLHRLKDTLKSDGILDMFKNREGNKILLDLMDRSENTPLREKIHTVLANGEPSKFYHDRWGIQIGSRSGPVGIEFKSFTEADAHQSKNNKKPRKKG